MALMGQREYARHRGVRLNSVQVAISTGRISITEDGKIDSEAADRQWDRNTDISKSRVKRQRAKADRLTAAKTRSELAHAEMREMELARQRGDLLPSADVKAKMFSLARMTRDRLLNVPDRIAALVAAERDAAKCHEIISSEIRSALEALANIQR